MEQENENTTNLGKVIWDWQENVACQVKFTKFRAISNWLWKVSQDLIKKQKTMDVMEVSYFEINW